MTTPTLSALELKVMTINEVREHFGIPPVAEQDDLLFSPGIIQHSVLSPTDAVLREVRQERLRQDGKWGQQNHPILGETSEVHHLVRQVNEKDANEWKKANDRRNASGTLGWDGILLEEVFEAFAEEDPRKVREEMVQVAAVAVGVIESLDRNELRDQA